MTTILVNTAADTVANDGKTSLREAIAQAANTAGHVDIRFDEETFYNSQTFAVTAIQLDTTLTIAKGDIAIDGSLFYGGSFYGLKITGASGLATTLLKIGTDATVTLRDMKLAGHSPVVGSTGANGLDGQNGQAGQGVVHANTGYVYFEDGSSGTAGSDATGGGLGGDGGAVVGAIKNEGALTLERVTVANFSVAGGNGGWGGSGGRGGKGGEGGNAPNDHSPSGSGGDGGDSGSGAVGGSGGGATAGIFNTGTLVLRDTAFSGLTATGGRGGTGGNGANGGGGGGWGYNWTAESSWPFGGDGGEGGDGGNGGIGGYAALALLNLGKVTFDGVQSDASGEATGGIGGGKGFRGEGGIGGSQYSYTGTGDTTDHDRHNGKNGAAGVDGKSGATGDAGKFLGASVTTGASFIIDAARTVISEEGDQHERTVYFALSLLGGTGSANSVKVTYDPGDGVAASDFVNGIDPATGFGNGTTPSNSKVFTLSADSTTYFGFVIAKDSQSEGVETFTLKLSDPHGGQLGWSKSVTVAIVDGSTDGHAPSAIKLDDTSIAEDVNNNTRLGKLSTTDADGGDQFTYSLVNSAGGRFKLVGNQVKVANGVLLDYEQAKSHKVVVRATDLFGNSLDKSFTIKVTDVAKENVVGDAGANKIVGGAKSDSLDGGGGNDTLTGGGDDDKFVFSTAPNAASNLDHITDFVRGHDRIVLDRGVFAGLAKGSLPSDAFHAGASAADREDRILYRNDGTLLFDKDGNKPGGAAPIAFAILDHHPALGAGDFLVI